MDYGCSIRVLAPIKGMYIIGINTDGINESMTRVHAYNKKEAHVEFKRLLRTMKDER